MQDFNSFLSYKLDHTEGILEELQMKYSEVTTLHELSEPLIISLKNQISVFTDNINQQQKTIADLKIIEQKYIEIKYKKMKTVSTQVNTSYKSKQSLQNKILHKNSEDLKAVPMEVSRKASKTLISKFLFYKKINRSHNLDKPNIQSVSSKQVHSDQINPDVKSLMSTNQIKYDVLSYFQKLFNVYDLYRESKQEIDQPKPTRSEYSYKRLYFIDIKHVEKLKNGSKNEDDNKHE